MGREGPARLTGNLYKKQIGDALQGDNMDSGRARVDANENTSTQDRRVEGFCDRTSVPQEVRKRPRDHILENRSGDE